MNKLVVLTPDKVYTYPDGYHAVRTPHCIDVYEAPDEQGALGAQVAAFSVQQGASYYYEGHAEVGAREYPVEFVLDDDPVVAEYRRSPLTQEQVDELYERESGAEK